MRNFQNGLRCKMDKVPRKSFSCPKDKPKSAHTTRHTTRAVNLLILFLFLGYSM
jgi:hypothetical protein